MSEQLYAPTKKPKIKIEYFLLGGVGLLLAIALFFVFSQRQQVLRTSPSGLDGLEAWLSSKSISAQSFTGGWPIDQDSVGLLIVPLYDTDLSAQKVWPETELELIAQQDEYDLGKFTIEVKRARVQTLVILPKWRSGMRLTGIGHPILLNDNDRLNPLVRELTGDQQASIIRPAITFYDVTGPQGSSKRAKFYAPQMISAPKCTPIIGEQRAMILARCPLTQSSNGLKDFLLLADPDLMNNHGLRLGDNAEIIAELVADIAKDKNVMIDYSTQNWLISQSRGPVRERTWADLLQFFAPPFTILWIAGAIILALVLWHAAVRFGPIIGTKIGHSASKILAVRARARLMRLSKQEAAMFADYARIRMSSLGAKIFGPAHARHVASEDGFMRYVARRHPQYAAPLNEILQNLRDMDNTVPTQKALAQIDELEHILEQIAHDT